MRVATFYELTGILQAIAEEFRFDKNLVIAYTISIDSAVRTESQIPVVHYAKEPTLFNDESALFRSVDQKIREQRFHVYAPVEWQDEKEKKKRILEYKSGILRLIDRLADPQVPLQLEGGRAK